MRAEKIYLFHPTIKFGKASLISVLLAPAMASSGYTADSANTAKSEPLIGPVIAAKPATAFLKAQEESTSPTNANAFFASLTEDAKILFDGRLRYSHAEFESLDLDANGLTYRIRAGFETGSVFDTKLLVEMEHTDAFSDQFNSTVNGVTNRPVVADPDSTELNRFQLTNTSFPDTKITLGRQRIIHDDARFIGNVVWRQNEQTYDGLRIENTSIPNLRLDISYIDKVKRIFGSNSIQRAFDSESIFAHANYAVPLNTDKVKLNIKAYAYLLDLDSNNVQALARRLSTATYGTSITLKTGGFDMLASYATQSDHADSSIDYTADYYKIQGSYTYKGLKGLAGYEVLGSDNGFGFVTPLATAHKFNGFADLFLATPGGGLTDFYFGADYTTKNFGPFALFKLAGTFHTFDADVGGQDYGDETNFLFVTKFKALKNVKFLVKYADFDAANGFAQDVSRLTIEANISF